MWRFLLVAALAAAISTARPALAQPASSKDDVKKLEAELDKLRSQMKDVEERLRKAKGGKRPASSWGKMDPDQIKKIMELFGVKGGFDPDQIKKMVEQFRKGSFDPDQIKKMVEQFRKPAEKKEGKSSDVEKRLDRIIKEVEELRREIKKN